MWPFRRKNAGDTTTPPEVQEYYQSENRQRSWMAWLLGLGALLATVLLVLGLFYGGRWVYNKVRTQDTPNTAQVEQENSENQKQTSEQSSGGNTSTGNQPAHNPPVMPTPTPAPAPTPTPTPNAGTQATNTQGKGTSDLPATGPADNAAIFLLVSAAGYLLHRRYQNAS